MTWDELARQNQRDILAYGTQTWGRDAARKMRLHMEPLLQGRSLQFRSLVIHEHYKLVYHYDETTETLRIAALWDTRREPRAQADNLK